MLPKDYLNLFCFDCGKICTSWIKPQPEKEWKKIITEWIKNPRCIECNIKILKGEI